MQTSQLEIEPPRGNQAPRILSADVCNSVSVLSPLTSGRPIKSLERAATNMSRLATDRPEESRRVQIVTDLPSLSVTSAGTPKISRTNPVPVSLGLIDKTKSGPLTTMNQPRRYTLSNSPKKERRVHTMTYNDHHTQKETRLDRTTGLGSRENVAALILNRNRNDDDRIIRPLAQPDYSRYPSMPDGKSKSFVLPDRSTMIPQRTVGPLTGSQTNLTTVDMIKNRATFSPTPNPRKNHQQHDGHNHYNHHHRHHQHHHHHHNHRCQRRHPPPTSSTCTSSTNHTITLPSSLSTITNTITAQSAASSRVRG